MGYRCDECGALIDDEGNGFNRVYHTSSLGNFYDDNEFDLYDKPVKLISPKDLAAQLKI